MCRGRVKNGPGLRNELPVERENAGLRNELDPIWAWKCESLAQPGHVWLALWPAANPLCVQAEPAVGGDERIEIKEILKMMVSGTAKSAKKCKMVMLRNRFLGNLWKWYMIRNGNSGLKMGVSRAAHTQYAYLWKYPPPPPPPPGIMWVKYENNYRVCDVLLCFYCCFPIQTHRLNVGEKVLGMRPANHNQLFYHTLHDIKVWNFNQVSQLLFDHTANTVVQTSVHCVCILLCIFFLH